MQLYQGDCLEVMKQIPDKSVDMILCDLPYGNLCDKTRANWDKQIDITKLCLEYRRIIKHKGAIILFGNEPFSSKLRIEMLDLFKYDIKWVKSKTTGFANANYRPMNKYEDILIFSEANASTGGAKDSMTYNPQGLIIVNKIKKNRKNRQGLVAHETNNVGKNNALEKETQYIQKYTNYPTNVIYYDSPKKYIHPTEKPVALCEYLIKTYTNENDIVLDNCMGSGTTGVACKHLNRNFIGIELDPKYFEIAKNRIENEPTRKRG